MVRAGFPGRFALKGRRSQQTYSAEATALFAAMTTQPTTARKALIDTMIVALKTAGVWAKVDVLWVMAAADSQAARLNWKNPGGTALTEVNSPLFTADRGYTGNGTSSYLTTGYNPGDGGTYKWLQNDACMGIWCLSSDTASSTKSGTGGITTTGADIKEFSTGSTIEVRINASGTATSSPTTTASSVGDAVGIRNNASSVDIFKNGLAFKTALASTSAAVISQQMFICGRSASGSLSQASNRQYAVAHFGGTLTSGEILAFYNAKLAYLQGVGAA